MLHSIFESLCRNSTRGARITSPSRLANKNQAFELRGMQIEVQPWRRRARNVHSPEAYILEMSGVMSSRPQLDPIRDPEAIVVNSFDETPIHYDLYGVPSRTLVLIVPGFWRDRRHASMVRLANWFGSGGYATAICDLRGHGDSGGTFGFNLNEHHDIAAVAHDVIDRCAPESITLIGLSYGAAIAISAAARHELPLASMLLVSPVADFAMVSPRINPF